MSIPTPFRRLVDDAAIFPPGLMPLRDAVPAHAAHLASAHADLVGPFIVATSHLPALAALTTSELAVSVVVPAPAEVPTTITDVAADPHLVLAGLEVKLDADRSPAAQVREVAAIERHGVPTYVEVPRPSHPEWPDVVTAAAGTGLRLKLRTGGTEAAAFPTEAEVATWIHDAVAAGVPFKCTAGLHNALRHTGVDTGFEHHGYLNILLATARASAGADVTELTAVLAERSPRAVADAVAGDPGVAAARTLFTSYGSCSVLEPLEDLEALDLIPTSIGTR